VTIAMVARNLMTPIPQVEDMFVDDLLAYHQAAMQILEMENKPRK
jgi:hypothetical protein